MSLEVNAVLFSTSLYLVCFVCSALLRLVSEVPVLEDTLMRVLLLGLDKDIHITAADALELADQLIRKAARLHTMGELSAMYELYAYAEE